MGALGAQARSQQLKIRRHWLEAEHFVVTPPPRTTTLSPEAVRAARAKLDAKDFADAQAECKKTGKKAVLSEVLPPGPLVP